MVVLKMYLNKYIGKRPIGQSAGDDAIYLKIKKDYAEAWESIAIGMGLEFSKIHSVSRDTATFCEMYVCRFPPGTDLSMIPKDEKFGDLVFLDGIKGSLLSGRSKVKMDGSDPFIGHAKMLKKQLEYLPKHLEWRKLRAKAILWSRHYRQAVKLSRVQAGLPPIMGGLGLAIGKELTLDDNRLHEKYFKYLYGLLDPELSQETILAVLNLLASIWRTNSKGFVWEADQVDLVGILRDLTIAGQQEVWKLLPEQMEKSPIMTKLRYLSSVHGYITLNQICEEMIRRFNFLEWWKGKKPQKPLLKTSMKHVVVRHSSYWNQIRELVKPKGRPPMIKDLYGLQNKLEGLTFGLYFNRNDPAVQHYFEGMPSLELVF